MNKIYRRLLLLMALSAVVQSAAVNAEEKQNPYLWKPQIKSVAVFKNGLAFYIREGKTELRDGWCVSEKIPPAAFGTLAVYANEEGKLVDIIGAGPGEIFEFDDLDRPQSLEAKRKTLELSLNLRVELRYLAKGEIKTATGEIIQVGTEFVILDNGVNHFAVPIDAVARMQALGLPLRLHVAEKTDAEENEHQQAAQESKDDKENQKAMSLGMAYLTKGGITWVPEYTLRMIDDENGELTLRGTVINEGEDLIHTDVHLVVGVPHFVHSDLMAPIAAGQAIRTIGTALSNQLNVIPSQIMSQAAMNQSAMLQNRMTGMQQNRHPNESSSMPDEAAGSQKIDEFIGNLPQLDTISGTDFNVYTKRDMTIRNGEKAIVTLFTQKVKFSHLYHWEVPGEVHHRLVLLNQTDSPWTTGPCLVVSPERQPLSEDVLKYTAKGARCELPITAAINMATSKNAREIDRATKKYSPNDHSTYYDLVTLEGELKLQSFEKKSVEVLVTATIPGTPMQLDENAVSSMNPDKLVLTEKEANVTWRFQMEPNERKSIKYQYERFVPSQ